MSADCRGYRGRSWQWWARLQLRRYDESQKVRRDEAFARTLDEIIALRTPAPHLRAVGGDQA